MCVSESQRKKEGRTQGCPTTYPRLDELVYKSQILSGSCGQGQRSIQQLVPKSLCLSTHPFSCTAGTPELIWDSPLLCILGPHY